MSLSTLLNTWKNSPEIATNIAAWRTFPGRPAQTQPFPADLHPTLSRALRDQRINNLYSHQATAWNHIQSGLHPVIVTGTASGKSLCYNLPILHHLLGSPRARALYLFPTKALAHDQSNALKQFINTLGHPSEDDQPPGIDLKSGVPHQTPISLATYDGDTPGSARAAIRNQARLIFTNPDMLHTAILPHHTRWLPFLSQLRFVVIDELHVYRGVFGSHVGNVIRRLKRVVNFYGVAPQFILTSATIDNPTLLAERLIEEQTVLVDHDGAAKGTRHFLIYNPPVINPELGVRSSVLQESVRFGQALLQQDIQTIIFGRTRRSVEMLLNYLRDRATPAAYSRFKQDASAKTPKASTSRSLHSTIRAYRSGYLPRQRRQIEKELREGQVRVVVATSALELGIDIGRMEAAVLTGYPGTIAGTWQQAGRAGRQSETSLAILITSANPLDQFLAGHPDYFFDRSPEQALINPDNLLILLQHLRCAVFELPFQDGDSFGWVPEDQVADFLQYLQESGEVHRSGQKYFWMADRYPAESVSLRSASPHTVRLQIQADAEESQNSENLGKWDGVPAPTVQPGPIADPRSGSSLGTEAAEDQRWITIGQVDVASADWMVHPQAIYLQEGQSYLVEALDLSQYIARLQPVNVDYYTEPLRETSVQLVDQLNHSHFRGVTKTCGEILVTTQVVGYNIVQWFTHERLGLGEVDLPARELHTTGYWLALAEDVVDQLRGQGLWSNDPNNYGPNWQAQRNRARARDGYCCRICGSSEQERSHDVHHKIPFRRFRSFQEANRLANLVTLCRPCHRRAETAVKMRSGLSGLAAALGHLAPLFLMCDPHDLGVHSDPQSPLSGGQPTIVIYDMTPGGIGFSERLFELHDDLIRHAFDLVTACPCADGCPSCVGPAGEEGVGGKQETAAILELLLTSFRLGK